jgi:tRNA(Ile)-lysidine synthase
VSILQLQHILDLYFRQHSISRDSKIAIGVSGGSDSMGLVLLLREYCSPSNLTLITIDHNLRKESADEALQVSQWARELNLAHEILVWRQHTAQGNLMSNARNARYKLLTDFCKKRGILYLFIGHTLDDQIETFFINLERGSGIDGLSAMEYIAEKDGVYVCRPLLGSRRHQIRDYLKAMKQRWLEDPTNDNERFLRVRVRKIFQEDQQFFDRVNLAIKNLQRAKHFISTQTEIAYVQFVRSEMIGIRYFDIQTYRAFDIELRLRILNRILEDLSPEQRKRRLHSIEILDALIMMGSLKNHELSSIGVSLKQGVVYFYPIIRNSAAINLHANNIYNFHGYNLDVGELIDGYKITCATKEQYLELKKQIKLFPSTLPYNMILNIPVVVQLEKIVFIPHIRLAGLVNLEIYIKSYL